MLLLFGSLLFSACISEIALRLIGYSAPYFTQVDARTGFSLRPGASGWQHEEGDAFIQINSAGMRDREHARQKPENTIRIAVLGDSYTEARQIPVEKTFWWRLPQELKTCTSLEDQNIEVWNFGVSGFGTTQELEMLRSRVWESDPDVVLLQFTTGNDIRNNSFALEKSDQKPYFRMESGTLVLDSSFQTTAFYRSQTSIPVKLFFWIIERSRVLQLLNRTRTALRQQNFKQASSPAVATVESGLDWQVYREPQDPQWQEAWTITEAILSTMAREVEEHGSTFAVLVGATSSQINPDPAILKKAADSLGVADLFYPDRRIERLGKKENFPVLAIAPAMQKAAEETQTFFNGFPNTGPGMGHWNEAGHAFAGKAAAEFLCPILSRL